LGAEVLGEERIDGVGNVRGVGVKLVMLGETLSLSKIIVSKNP
jgi:hypothetical protein